MLYITQIYEERAMIKYIKLKDIFFITKLHVIISRTVKTHGWQQNIKICLVLSCSKTEVIFYSSENIKEWMELGAI